MIFHWLPDKPKSPIVGEAYYDTIDQVARVWNGSSWCILASHQANENQEITLTEIEEGSEIILWAAYHLLVVSDLQNEEVERLINLSQGRVYRRYREFLFETMEDALMWKLSLRSQSSS